MTPDVLAELRHLRERLEELAAAVEHVQTPEALADVAVLMTMHSANAREFLYRWSGVWKGVCAAGFPMDQTPHPPIDIVPCYHYQRRDVLRRRSSQIQAHVNPKGGKNEHP